jgi:hypothetical protein
LKVKREVGFFGLNYVLKLWLFDLQLHFGAKVDVDMAY